MSFLSKGSQILVLRLKSWFKSRMSKQHVELKYKTRIKLVRELYDTCFQYNATN